MIAAHSRLIGVSDKQIDYGLRRKQEIQRKYPDASLPDNPYAEFWIDNYGATPEQLRQRSLTDVYSPFTKSYPLAYQRFTRSNVEPLLKHMSTWAVVDTETTGLPTGENKIENPEIVEMTIIAVESEEFLFHSLFRPYDIEAYFSSDARHMHVYREEAYLNAPTFKDKWEEIQAIISKFHLVAYSANFDIPMIQSTAQLWGIPAPRMRGTCVMKMFEAFMNTESTDGRTYKLSEACALMGIDQEKYGCPHTALADTLATHELLMRMKETVTAE